MTFEARVLGPVEASLDGRPVALGSPKQRAVFALLEAFYRDVLRPRLADAGLATGESSVSEVWGFARP